MSGVTEQEASELWCPFARVPDGSGSTAVANRHQQSNRAVGMCIGSRCMAWRQTEEYRPTGRKVERINDDDTKELVDEYNCVGYCGLAGPTT